MKKLYLKLTELLSEIPELKYIDLNFGQLQEEKPPLAYPAVLINLSCQTADDAQDYFQVMQGNFEITLICKMLSESNANATIPAREKALEYLDLSEKIYRKLQGYEADGFFAFTRKNVRDQNIRKGLKTTVMSWETGWHSDMSTP